MNNVMALFFLFLSLSVAGTVIGLVILGLKLFSKNRFSMTWHYYIWLVVMLRLLLPISFEVNITRNVVDWFQNQNTQYVSAPVPSPSIDVGLYEHEGAYVTYEIYRPVTATTTSVSTLTNALNAENIWAYLGILWLVVGFAVALYKVCSYHKFIRPIKASMVEISDFQVADLYLDICRQLKIRRPPKLYISHKVQGPMLMGLWHPTILLPTEDIAPENLRNIFLHELTHYLRKDILYKWLAQLTVCLHWYNPLVHFANREINRQGELSCDERIIRNMDENARISYGDTLISQYKSGGWADNSVYVSLTENGRLLKERIYAIGNFRPKSKASTFTMAILACILIASSMAIGVYAAPSDQISYQENEVVVNLLSLPNLPYLPSLPYLPNLPSLPYLPNLDSSVDRPVTDRTNFAQRRDSAIAHLTPAEIDEMGFAAFERRDTAIFSLIMEHMSNSAIIQIFNLSAEQGITSFFALTQDYAIAGMTQAEIDAIGFTAFEARNTGIFSLISSDMSNSAIVQIFNLSAEQGITSFFALTQDYATAGMTQAEIDAIGFAAFEGRNTGIFSIISSDMSNSAIVQIFNLSAEQGITSFFALTQDYATAGMTQAEIDAIGFAAFERRNTGIFSMIMQYISPEQSVYILRRAIEERQTAFVSLLL